jgi:hypothetical protein
MLDAGLDFLGSVGFAAPAIDLRPPGNAGFYAMAREIAVDRFIVAPLRG